LQNNTTLWIVIGKQPKNKNKNKTKTKRYEKLKENQNM
jgi:hypothetical protein